MSEEQRDPANPHPGMEVIEVDIDRIHSAQALVSLAPADRAQIALQSSKTEAALVELASKHAGITEIKDKAGREQAHGAAMELMRTRTSIADLSKKARDDATKFSRAVIAEETRLIAIIEPEEKRLKALRDAWDEEQERIKREKAEAERKRLLKISEQIGSIKAFGPLAAQCRTSARIQELIERLTAMEISPELYEEFTEDAAAAKSVTLNQMAAALKAKQEAEAEAARLADLRAEQERVRQEQEERQRQLDAQAAELARQKRELEAARTAAEAPLVLCTDTVVIPITGSADIPAAMAAVQETAAEQTPPTSQSVQQPPAAEVKRASRPTDDEIIDALALHFRVHESKVIEWLLAMDLQAASERLAAEFA